MRMMQSDREPEPPGGNGDDATIAAVAKAIELAAFQLAASLADHPEDSAGSREAKGDVLFRRALAGMPLGSLRTGEAERPTVIRPGAPLAAILSRIDGKRPFGPFGLAVSVVPDGTIGVGVPADPVAAWLLGFGASGLLLSAGPGWATRRTLRPATNTPDPPEPLPTMPGRVSRIAVAPSTLRNLASPAQRCLEHLSCRKTPAGGWSGSLVAEAIGGLMLGGLVADLESSAADAPTLTAIAKVGAAVGAAAVDRYGRPLLTRDPGTFSKGFVLGPPAAVDAFVAALGTEPLAPTPLFRHRGLFTG